MVPFQYCSAPVKACCIKKIIWVQNCIKTAIFIQKRNDPLSFITTKYGCLPFADNKNKMAWRLHLITHRTCLHQKGEMNERFSSEPAVRW
jgi:hypothetical protein